MMKPMNHVNQMQRYMRGLFRAIMLLMAVSVPVAMVAAKPIGNVSVAMEKRMEDALRSGEIIRLHIIAQDDSYESQILKFKLRDAIVRKFGGALSASDFDEACERVRSTLSEIGMFARREANANGFNGDVTVSFRREAFPDKSYAGTVVPGGVYDALIVEIGDARGRNWWCVMYPPLCMIPADTPVAARAALRGSDARRTLPAPSSVNLWNVAAARAMADPFVDLCVPLAEDAHGGRATFGGGLFYSAIYEFVRGLFCGV